MSSAPVGQPLSNTCTTIRKTGLWGLLLMTWGLSLAQVSQVEDLQPLDGVPNVNQSARAQPGGVYRDCNHCPAMVVMPAGMFWMGSAADAAPDPFSDAQPLKRGESNERPQHPVQIRAFALGLFEVTQEQWYAVMGSNPSRHKGRTLPVVNITWDDAQLYVQKLSQQTGQRYRLPTEAEWEYAARSGSTTLFPWGDTDMELHVHAWFNSIAHAPNPVGLKNPNRFGLYDTVGNVAEWTQDCWNDHFKGAPQDGSAWTSGSCSLRVVRGGSWENGPLDMRSAKRTGLSKGFSGSTLGLRVVREL